MSIKRKPEDEVPLYDKEYDRKLYTVLVSEIGQGLPLMALEILDNLEGQVLRIEHLGADHDIDEAILVRRDTEAEDFLIEEGFSEFVERHDRIYSATEQPYIFVFSPESILLVNINEPGGLDDPEDLRECGDKLEPFDDNSMF